LSVRDARAQAEYADDTNKKREQLIHGYCAKKVHLKLQAAFIVL
jgi:hypothetical protein